MQVSLLAIDNNFADEHQIWRTCTEYRNNRRATSITCICKSYAYCFSTNIVRGFDCCPSLNYGNSLWLDYFVKQAIWQRRFKATWESKQWRLRVFLCMITDSTPFLHASRASRTSLTLFDEPNKLQGWHVIVLGNKGVSHYSVSVWGSFPVAEIALKSKL